jgi:hypothetical protein
MVVLSCSMNGVTSWHKIRAGARGLRYNGEGVSLRCDCQGRAVLRGNGEGVSLRCDCQGRAVLGEQRWGVYLPCD